MKILVACEYSGRVRNAFRANGHDAWSCDILPSEDNSKHHIKGDVSKLLEESWDLIVAHPPCTYLSNSGVRWLYEKPGRWEDMFDSCMFFLDIARANSPRIAIENPVMHKHARNVLVDYNIGYYGFREDGKPNFTCQPYQFGDPERKRTCFWTKGLPELVSTSDMKKEEAKQSVWMEGPNPDRWKNRSRTFQGIANAIADQWGI